MATDYPTYAFSLLVLFGGVVGFLKKGSVPSLVAGLVFSAILAFGATRTSVNPKDVGIVLVTSLVLALFMGSRFYKTGRFMPAGLVFILRFKTCKMSFYSINTQIEYGNHKVPVLKPDHVFIGKCAICHEFVRKYSSINDIEIVNMLRDDCNFKGFKRIKVESAEEEGFANMHFVLILSNGNVTKELCVRRTNRLNLKMDNLMSSSEVITDSCSAVLIVVDKNNQKLELYYFRKTNMKKIEMDYKEEGSWKFFLVSDILYIEKNSLLYFVNFRVNEPFTRKVEVKDYQEVIVKSNESVVLLQKINMERPTLVCDTLQKDIFQKLLVPPDEIIDDFMNSKLTVLHVRNKLIWLACGSTKVSLYTSSAGLDELSLCMSVHLNELFPLSSDFVFSSECYCSSTNEVFLIYSKAVYGQTSSFVIILNMVLLSVTSVLELEMTLNRRPQIVMHASRSGHKLFVQETFENRVIFYQVFRILPSNLTLQNITKQVIWESLSESIIDDAFLPKHLKDELYDGF